MGPDAISPAVGALPHHGGMYDALPPPGYLTAQDTARALHISAGALRNLVYRGQLHRAGGTDRYPWYAVDEVEAIAVKRAKSRAA